MNYFGIDPQVVADQASDILGPIGSVSADSVSGSVVGLCSTNHRWRTRRLLVEVSSQAWNL